MHKLLVSAATVLALSLAYSTQSFAVNAEDAYDKCRTEAEGEEVADADLKLYVSNCMKDMGVSAADSKKILDEEFSPAEQEGDKTPAG